MKERMKVPRDEGEGKGGSHEERGAVGLELIPPGSMELATTLVRQRRRKRVGWGAIVETRERRNEQSPWIRAKDSAARHTSHERCSD